jgi:ribosomal protein S18 acetylase RimI-like enzyme
MPTSAKVTPFDPSRHHDQVVTLWTTVFGYPAAHNNPSLAIQKKLEINDGLFFVAESESGAVLGTVMAGYDGHRGWIYSLAVRVTSQRAGIGSALMHHAEAELESRGCVKINLQILSDNEDVQHFYEQLGYTTEPRVSMGKQLANNIA